MEGVKKKLLYYETQQDLFTVLCFGPDIRLEIKWNIRKE